MFSFVNMGLLWGGLAIAAPIAIHLLLRQRPKDRPWAAMTWLLAALEVAQRRYRLTNLLLLLLRCLIVALLALALARPSLAGFGSGGRLLLVIDTTASMGALRDGTGALAAFRRAMSEASIDTDAVVVLTVDRRVNALTGGQSVDPRRALRLLEELDATPVPGGLDRAATGELAEAVLAHCDRNTDVLLVSDFRQDDGTQLEAVLRERVRSVNRLPVGESADNAFIAGIAELPEPAPGAVSELALRVAGTPRRASLSVDDGSPLPVELSVTDGLARVALPPLGVGEHRVRVRLHDDGLTYDDAIELPLRVRKALPTLVVGSGRSMLGTALAAAGRYLDVDRLRADELASRPLESDGLILLRERPAAADELVAWVEAGGILWASYDMLRADSELAGLVAGLEPNRDQLLPGGVFNSGEPILDSYLRHAGLGQSEKDGVSAFILPGHARVLLRAGEAPLVVALQAGRGRVVCELVALESLSPFWALGASTLWVQRSVRQLAADAGRPRLLQAGMRAQREQTLVREGERVSWPLGAPLLVAPGLWQAQTSDAAEAQPVLVFADPEESRLTGGPPASAIDIAAVLPRARGRDWGLPLLILVLLVALGEGAFAAWAGRAYGR
ncbi:MAG: BatA domain-containing protein [Planctomycetota bacterium]